MENKKKLEQLKKELLEKIQKTAEIIASKAPNQVFVLCPMEDPRLVPEDDEWYALETEGGKPNFSLVRERENIPFWDVWPEDLIIEEIARIADEVQRVLEEILKDK